MKNIRLLDCTLRDGAYINDARFGKNSIKGIIENLVASNVEIIECGWLKNEESNEDSTYFHVPSDLEKYNIEKKDSKLSLMIDYNRYSLENLKNIEKIDGIDYIRITFPIDHVKEGLQAGKEAQKKGVKICFQLTNAKSYLDKSIFTDNVSHELFGSLNSFMPVSVCLADTFGSMTPNDIEEVSKIFDKNLDATINLGLHTHNNMQLAFANTIKFIDVAKNFNRDIIVDSSLLGMGRGAGNTPTEVLTDYLNKYHNKNYDLNIIFETIDKYMMEYFEKYSWGYSPYLAVAGMTESHINNTSYLREKYNVNSQILKKILDVLEKKYKPKYNYDILNEIYNRVK